MVMTMKPCVRDLAVVVSNYKGSTEYHFPYLLLTFNSSGVLDLYFAFEDIGEKTYLYSPQLPNFGVESTACFGSVKIPDIKTCSLEELRTALWDVVFKGVYTAHSKSSVYQEMVAQKVLVKYAKKTNAGKYMGLMYRLVNASITGGEFNLFREW